MPPRPNKRRQDKNAFLKTLMQKTEELKKNGISAAIIEESKPSEILMKRLISLINPAKIGLLALCLAVALPSGVMAQEALLKKGISQYQSGNQYAALQSLSAYIKSNPEDFRGYFWRSQLYIRTASNEAALDDLNQVIRLSPGNPDGHYLRGVVLMLKREPARACLDLVRASELGQKTAAGEAKKYCHEAT